MKCLATPRVRILLKGGKPIFFLFQQDDVHAVALCMQLQYSYKKLRVIFAVMFILLLMRVLINNRLLGLLIYLTTLIVLQNL